mmetsp:Transcript_74334/g.187287  ORF Transcript_74334/g.187287 Transcript_74334/m.187287 type:complete len:280 (-) Transcript_74334:247-1086(-)
MEDSNRSARVMTGLAAGSASSTTGSGPGGSGAALVAAAAGADDDGGPQNVYSSMSVEEESEDAKLARWQSRWLGRILAWRVPCGVVYIGPHWYCSVIMLTFILGVGTFYCNSAVQTSQLLGGLSVTFLSTTTFLRCALANPGVIEARRGHKLPAGGGEDAAEHGEGFLALAGADSNSGPARTQRGRSSSGSRHCNICDIPQPRGCSHCEFCQVCIDGFDHHCPWMGKCIGRKNLCAFYTFIAVSMSSLGYIFLSTLMSGPSPHPTPSSSGLSYHRSFSR